MNKQNKHKQTNKHPKYLNATVIFWVTEPIKQKKKAEENQKLNKKKKNLQ